MNFQQGQETLITNKYFEDFLKRVSIDLQIWEKPDDSLKIIQNQLFCSRSCQGKGFWSFLELYQSTYPHSNHEKQLLQISHKQCVTQSSTNY